MKKLISVIVPCYNIEDYIEECIDSILNQTIGTDAIELILVNDASTDATLDVLLRYEREYPTVIMVINCLENLRQGGARNIGIHHASGEYIMFVDGDDWIEETMLEKLYKTAQTYNCDMTVGNYRRVSEGRVLDVGNCPEKEEFIKIESTEERRKFLNKSLPCTGVWGSIYKRKIIVDNEVYFPEKLAYEDNFWADILSFYLNSVCIIPEVFYNYRYNPESTTSKLNSYHHFDRLVIELLKLEEYERRSLVQEFYYEIEIKFLIMFYCNTINIIPFKFDTPPIEMIREMCSTVLEVYPNYKMNPYISGLSKDYQALLQTIEMGLSREEWIKFFSLIH